MAERIAAGDALITLRTRIARQVTLGKQRYRLALELHIGQRPGRARVHPRSHLLPAGLGRDGGSGLGLTLAQTFVQQHQGTIECESEPGRTVFKIPLPFRCRRFSMKPIWIVDDDQSIRFVLEKALAREDSPCAASPTRATCSPRWRRRAAGAGVDIRMPGGSGIDLLGKVKARHPGLPVIIMTAYSDLDSAVAPSRAAPSNTCPSPSTCPRRWS